MGLGRGGVYVMVDCISTLYRRVYINRIHVLL